MVVDDARVIYYMVYGSVAATGAGTFLPEFRRIATSLKRKAAYDAP
jgi:hypothetical protein